MKALICNSCSSAVPSPPCVWLKYIRLVQAMRTRSNPSREMASDTLVMLPPLLPK